MKDESNINAVLVLAIFFCLHSWLSYFTYSHLEDRIEALEAQVEQIE